MIKRLVRLLPVSFLALCPALVRAELEASALDYHQCAGLLAASDVPSGRQYAPDRDVQVLHLALEATPDFQQRMLEGKATLQFRPLLKPVRELSLDAVDLNVRSVTSPQVIQGYQVTAAKLLITFAADLPPGKDASVTVTYQAEPKMGLYFRTPEMGYKTGEEQLFTQGEPIEARHWYPCLDAPNHQCTSEITCRVPEGMTVISNGRLVSSDKDAASGLMAFHWTQEQPHANYLISMCAGFFNKIEDNYKGVPLRFYTPPSQIQNALGTFRHTKDILAFFEDEIGVAYPWAKYDQVCVNDFMAGGMENTSATTLGAAALFTDASENIRQTEGLVSHELAHQWFGDLVTCKDWSHLWLNEGFATYYETLYNGHHNGHDAMIYELYGRARMITSQPEDVNAIVRRTYNGPTELFGWLAYQKGSWVLHMLRSQLGEDLFRRCIKTYLERHHHANAVTEDLRRVIEELSGRSYDQFFDQWVFHAHHPELEVSYQWDESAKLAKLAIRQVQRLGDQVLLFNFPLTIRCKGGFGTVDRTIQVMQNEQEVSLALESAPEIVRLDPDYTVLAKIAFTVPNAMLDAQLAAKDDVAGRLLAVEQLSSRSDRRTVGKLQEALNTDAFFGVRLEAAKALRAIHSDAALDALLASTAQADARVRREVVSDVAGFYRESAYQAARNTLEHETNPDILAPAIRALGAYSKPGTCCLDSSTRSRFTTTWQALPWMPCAATTIRPTSRPCSPR